MKGMSTIVKTIAGLISGLIFLFGIYIVLHGHLTPGGGFAGGVVIAGSFILLFLAFGSDEAKSEIKKWRASFGESLGILIFWLIALLGILGGTFFFLNVLGKGQPFTLLSAGIIPLCNIGIGIEVAAALFSIFITLAVLKLGEK
jgi:multicomponent Na+:H+ antiporter subunit B